MSRIHPNTTDKIVRLPKGLLASDRFFVVFLQLHQDKSGSINGTMTTNGGRGAELRHEVHGTRDGNTLSLWSVLPSGERTPATEVILEQDGSVTMYPPPGSSPTLHFQPASLRQYHAAVKQRQA